MEEAILAGKTATNPEGTVLVKFSESAGSAQVYVPLSKSQGGKYYLNKRLLALERNGGFEQVGSRMVGRIPTGKLGEALRVLWEDTGLRLTELHERRFSRATYIPAGRMDVRRLTKSDLSIIASRVRLFGDDVRTRILTEAEASAELARMRDDLLMKKSRLRLSPDEYSAVESAIAQREYVFGNENQYGYVFTANNFYAYTKSTLAGEHTIDFSLPIEGNREVIDGVISKIENGSFRSTRDVVVHYENSRRRGRGNADGSIKFAKERRGDGRAWSVRVSELSDERANNGEASGDSQSVAEREEVGDVLRRKESVNDESVRHLRDENGEIFGWYDLASREVVVVEGARVDTLLHELGGHATWDWARRNSPELYAKLREYAANAPESVLSEVRENYPELSESSDAFADEVFAHAFAAEHAGTLEAVLETEKARGWWAGLKRLFSRAWRAMMRVLGKNRVEARELSELSPEEAVSRIGEAFFAGRELVAGEVGREGAERTSAELNVRGAARLRYQRARTESQDALRQTPNNGTWNAWKSLYAEVAELRRSVDELSAEGADAEAHRIRKAREREAKRQAREMEAQARLRRATRAADKATSERLRAWKIPEFGSAQGGVEGWAGRVETGLRKAIGAKFEGDAAGLFLFAKSARCMETLKFLTYSA